LCREYFVIVLNSKFCLCREYFCDCVKF